MPKTLINIDAGLLRKAQRLTGQPTKVAVVNQALEDLVRQREVARGLLALAGRVKGHWEVKAWRRGRHDFS